MATPNNKKKALGLGIKALLNNIDEELKATSESIRNSDAPVAKGEKGPAIAPAVGGRIPVDEVIVNPKQPRIDFDEEALNELAESIKLHDIIQPVTVVKLVNGKYMLVSGERRWWASQRAGLKDIPAYIRVANDQALNAIEISLSYKRLMDECDLTQEQLAERMKKDRSTVANYLRLLKLPPDIQTAVRDNSISMGHARSIISLDKVEEQLYVYREIRSKGLSVRQTEQLVKNMQQEKKPAASAKDDKKLPPAYKRIEDDMASHFSTKVVLNRKKNGKGNITIDFYSDEQLERIMELMNL